jgi:drug/metabolite transporter (DMT)-like permease
VVTCRPAMRLAKSVRADLALILITVIWGCTFTLVKKSLAQVSPITLIALRFWVATAVILLWMPRAFLHVSRATLRSGAILSIFLLGGFVFQTLGLRSTTPARSAFITALSVLLVPVLGFLIFRHRPRPRTLAGVAVAATGLGFLTLDRMELALNRGDVLTLICAFVFAFHILFVGHYVTDDDYRQLVAIQVAGSALLCTVILPIFEVPFVVWDPALAVYVFVLGVLATAVAYYGQNWAQRFTTANRTALIFSLEPFFAAMFAYALLDQTLATREWVGGILVIAGIVISEYRRA